jgi:hypothetical protein
MRRKAQILRDSFQSNSSIVDRVVRLSNSEHEVHYIGVNWSHHTFANQDFTVVGADWPRWPGTRRTPPDPTSAARPLSTVTARYSC